MAGASAPQHELGDVVDEADVGMRCGVAQARLPLQACSKSTAFDTSRTEPTKGLRQLRPSTTAHATPQHIERLHVRDDDVLGALGHVWHSHHDLLLGVDV